ncbi:polymerase delta-interacting protein 2-like isoform X2 [Tubulanus polymorphus]|uniref:polymerase delta-interacting protein 2-like isoform X2 n=1 Tax=Tubulanus polymorphus TaxID=672921 RepID=UPI003DA5BCDD
MSSLSLLSLNVLKSRACTNSLPMISSVIRRRKYGVSAGGGGGGAAAGGGGNAVSGRRLVEVGVFEEPKLQGKYETGQVLLHKVFGYRGIVLFPWVAKVYDKDIKMNQNDPNRNLDDPNVILNKETRAQSQTYYQVLIDSRDCPFIRAQSEAVTFLGNQENSRSLYAIPGLDYVGHEDVLPYNSTEKHPIKHELFEKFLIHDPDSDPPFIARETLRAWQEKNHPWLELSDVHRQTTENIRVTVIPFYMGSRQSQIYLWRYCIRLENLSDQTVRLRERHWKIYSLTGTLETVRGRGVVGQEPSLSKKQPAFQYSSHVSLQAPSGHMWGTFEMEREDGTTFQCIIPPFLLESKRNEDQPQKFS